MKKIIEFEYYDKDDNDFICENLDSILNDCINNGMPPQIGISYYFKLNENEDYKRAKIRDIFISSSTNKFFIQIKFADFKLDLNSNYKTNNY